MSLSREGGCESRSYSAWCDLEGSRLKAKFVKTGPLYKASFTLSEEVQQKSMAVKVLKKSTLVFFFFFSQKACETEVTIANVGLVVVRWTLFTSDPLVVGFWLNNQKLFSPCFGREEISAAPKESLYSIEVLNVSAVKH
jgi:hypothetical protein